MVKIFTLASEWVFKNSSTRPEIIMRVYLSCVYKPKYFHTFPDSDNSMIKSTHILEL